MQLFGVDETFNSHQFVFAGFLKPGMHPLIIFDGTNFYKQDIFIYPRK